MIGLASCLHDGILYIILDEESLAMIHNGAETQEFSQQQQQLFLKDYATNAIQFFH